jgi:hypothetical protein
MPRPLGGVIHSWQNAVASAVHTLQETGAIRPKPTGPAKPRGTVEIEEFVYLTRLNGFEIQTLFRQVDTLDLAKALMGKGIEDVTDWCRENLSERVWGFIEIERSVKEAPASEIKAVRNRMLETVHQLQFAKAIRPSKKGPVMSDRMAVKTFGDLMQLTNREIQEMLRETELLELAIALKGTARTVRNVEGQFLVNMSERVGIVVRILRNRLWRVSVSHFWNGAFEDWEMGIAGSSLFRTWKRKRHAHSEKLSERAQ